MSPYKVKLEVFEGPLDLLLHLIKINEMEIHDIRIAQITEQYLSYLRLMETLDLDVAGDFIVMAATLVNIKLRSLLPDSDGADEDEDEVADILTAQALMEKLVEYRRFKQAAGDLREREQVQAATFLRDVALPSIARADGDAEMQLELEQLLQAFSRVVRFVDRRSWHLVTEEEFSVDEKISVIEGRLAEQPRIELDEFFGECGSKLEMIVTLLAMLELFHERRLRVDQADAFGPIYIFAPSGDEFGRAEAPGGEPAKEGNGANGDAATNDTASTLVSPATEVVQSNVDAHGAAAEVSSSARFAKGLKEADGAIAAVPSAEPRAESPAAGAAQIIEVAAEDKASSGGKSS